MKRKSLLLYLPIGRSNRKAIGGQVTAANGIVHFFKEKNLKYDIVDSAQATGLNWFSRRVKILSSISCLLYYSLFNRYRSSLFFYSKIDGLALRFLPALALRLHGATTSIFFRNSNITESSKYKILILRLFLLPYSLIFVQGSNLKNVLIEMGLNQDRIFIVPNWLSFDSNGSNSNLRSKNNSMRKFIFSGNISKNKGVFELLDAVKAIKQKNRFTLTFVGDGDAKEACREYCNKHQLSNVYFIKTIPHFEMRNLLAQHDVLVLPSYNEGFPNSVLEAMSVGLPVIVTNVGEVTDTVVHAQNGIVIEPKSVETLKSALEVYIINSELIALHGQEAMSSVKIRHDWRTNCQALKELLLP